jgi:uncharacterized membrane protein YqjE
VANYTNHEKGIAEVLREMKAEASEFAATRFELFAAEMKEKAGKWKASLPMLVVAAVLALGTFATFTFTLVSLLATVIGGAYAWTFGALIVCVVYGAAAAALGYVGIKRLTAQSLAPERTMRVLRQDRDWIKEEARAA